MINRQNIIALFMALLLTIFLLGCTSKQAEETPATPVAVPEAAQEAAIEAPEPLVEAPEAVSAKAVPSLEMPAPGSDAPEAVVAEAPEEPAAAGEGAY